MNYRQVHLDFHTSEAIDQIGDRFSKENFQAALKAGHVDSITIFAKCHHGWMYYPSDEYPMHPGLKYDLLAAQIEAAAEINVKTPIYLSAGLDERLAQENEGWLIRDKNDRTTWISDFVSPGYHRFCFNSPYTDILLKQIKEVAYKYKPEKIFLDISPAIPCYCSYCRHKLKERGKSLHDEKAVQDLAFETYIDYTRRVRKTIDDVDSSIGVFHNGQHNVRGNSESLGIVSHIEVESLPTGAWGYIHMPMTVSYTKTLPYDYLGMTGKFHTSWGEFGGYKHPNALKYETSLLLSFGAKCSIGDQMHPSGEMDMSTYQLIGAAYSEVEKKERWSDHTGFVSDIAVFPCQTFGEKAQADTVDAGVTRALLENHVLFDFVDIDTDISRYKLVILPDAIQLTSKLKDKLISFIDNGGRLLATGDSCIDETDGSFVFDFGGKHLGISPFSPSYIRPDFDLKSLNTADFVVYSKMHTVEGDKSLAKIRYPYFNRDVTHFCSHQHAPAVQEDMSDGILIGTHGCYIAYPIFAEYITQASLMNKEILLEVIDRLLGKKITVTTNLPAQGVVTIMENTDRRQYVVHMVYGFPVKRGIVEVVEDLIPVHNIELSLRLPNPVKKVTLPLTGENPELKYENDRLLLQGLSVDCHQIVVLEY